MMFARHIATVLAIVASLTVVRSDGYGQDNHYKNGSIVLDLNFPYVNAFSFSSEKMGDVQKAGFLGVGLGFDIYTSDKSYLCLTGKTMMDFFMPVPAPVRYGGGEYNFLSSNYVSVSQNHVWRKFHFGYGIALGRNNWRYRYFGSYDKNNPDSIIYQNDDRDERRNVVGLIASCKYQITKRFYVSLTYRPTIVQIIDKPIWRDEHLVSIEFGWRFRIRK